MGYIFLDNASTTPVIQEVADLMDDINRNVYGNPSSTHRFGAIAKDRIEESRFAISNQLNIPPSDLIFTSGATESITSILLGTIDSLGIKHIISSKLEHPATLNTLERISKSGRAEISFVDFDSLGHINMNHLEDILKNSQNALVCLMHVNNELGNLLQMKKVSEMSVKYGALFFSDTVQSIGKFDNDFSQYPDFAVGSAHKFHGPKGVGFMVIRGKNRMSPLFIGGAQERNMRAGTENLAGIVGMAEALKIAMENLKETMSHIALLKASTIEMVSNQIPDAVFNGDIQGISTILNIGLPRETHNKMVVFNLDTKGIAVSGGSACSSGVMNVSHVIKSLGLDKSLIPIRVSFSKFNTLSEVELFVNMLKNY